MSNKPLFGICPDAEFFGRGAEIEYMVGRLSGSRRPAAGVVLTGGRWTGKTEVLRRVHRGLFWEQSSVWPVYYQFRGYGTAEGFAEDYLKEVLKQYIAFRRRDTAVAGAEVSLDKLERMLIDDGDDGAADLVLLFREARKASDAVAALRGAIAAPRLLSEMTGSPACLVLDDLEKASASGIRNDGAAVLAELMESLGSGSNPFVIAAGSRRPLEGGSLNGSIDAMELSGLADDLAVSMMTDLGRSHNLAFDSEVLAMAARRLGGNPMYMKNFIWAVCRAQRELTDLKDLTELYTEEITEGNIGFILRSSIRLKGLNDLRLLKACLSVRPGGATSEEELADKLRLSREEVSRGMDELGSLGLVEANLGSVRWTGDVVIKDFIGYMHEMRVKGRSSDEVRSSMVLDSLKQGFARTGVNSAGRLKDEAGDLARSFNGQKVLKVLLRNQSFSARFKNGALSPAGTNREDELTLPQVVGCFDSSSLEKNEAGPAILIANGFQNLRYDAGNEIVWFVGVKDGFSPVNLGDAESFLRRTSLLKQNYRNSRQARWMIASDGFTSEALKRLEAESVYTSDSVQFGLLKQGLEDRRPGGSRESGPVGVPNKEFEVVLPASSKAELVAAKAVEEIGVEMGFDEKAIGQIKASLVEACINAFEHSGGKATRVFLRFVAYSDRLVVDVRNSGVDFDGHLPSRPLQGGDALPRKRGWGMELMKGLMDEVRLERVRGGARIVLVKYLLDKGERRDEEA